MANGGVVGEENRRTRRRRNLSKIWLLHLKVWGNSIPIICDGLLTQCGMRRGGNSAGPFDSIHFLILDIAASRHGDDLIGAGSSICRTCLMVRGLRIANFLLRVPIIADSQRTDVGSVFVSPRSLSVYPWVGFVCAEPQVSASASPDRVVLLGRSCLKAP